MPICKWHTFRMTPCLIRYLSIYFERKIFYIMENLATILLNCLENFSVSMLWMKVSTCWNIVEFPKISIKMKNCTTFYQAQRASCLKEIIKPVPHPTPPTPNQIKSYNVSGPKTILQRYTKIYRHLLSKCFKNVVVLGRQEMVQCKCFFWHQTGKYLLENL